MMRKDLKETKNELRTHNQKGIRRLMRWATIRYLLKTIDSL